MRKLLWAVLVLLIMWCVWWAVAAFGLRTAIETWLEDRRGFGWQAESLSHDSTGFPLRIESALTGIALANPARGVAVNIPQMSISTPIWWPGDVKVTFTDAPMQFFTPQSKASVTAANAHTDLRLHPGTSLELEGLTANAGAWDISTPDGGLYAADRLTMQMLQSPDAPQTYTFFAIAPRFTLGSSMRKELRVPVEWPVSFDRLELGASITFDRPWDIRALEDRAPQPRVIKLDLAEAAWGDLRLFAAADLEVDDTGVPTGTLNLQAENWQTMLDLAEGAGLLPSQLRTQAQEGLGLLARMSGDPTALDVQLNFRSGFMSVGIIPIGPAPRIILR
ncbi:hypothetical protein ASD8599_00837 [Ascidiaceihabitans donghaensis]|uniref:DUF2125 domain-containing protein n=1 Tax=Ascidiaceihabitans donghaensis TaxID=1510460 RepID=A0A2R8BAK3_9RHOB|nr:DUF2125 domain-containing protein [Ascidiaceihabitans donghaensis]SPH20099.1 hypothetical protein ASD8599_00837 [Ascidiaceihabitans donghaensis]